MNNFTKENRSVNTQDLVGALKNAEINHENHVLLPLPPEATDETRFEMEVYARFMRHLRRITHSRVPIKVLSAIQFTADMMEISDALVAKTLVDLGLRGPRRSFPAGFLAFTDRTLTRNRQDLAGTPTSIVALVEYWNKSGEGKFVGATNGEFAIYNTGAYATV